MDEFYCFSLIVKEFQEPLHILTKETREICTVLEIRWERHNNFQADVITQPFFSFTNGDIVLKDTKNLASRAFVFMFKYCSMMEIIIEDCT